MRLEAKHREASQYMHGVANRKNVALTVAIKAQLKMSNRYLQNKDPISRLCIGSGVEDLLSNQSFYEEFKNILDDAMSTDPVFIANNVTNYNKRYSSGNVIQLIDDNEDNYLYGIQVIFEYDKKIFLVCKKYDAQLKHNMFYEISPTN